ncbi:MAG: UDP-N-acetylmuramoyl-tripeptide--D-alanyl-D-alanine ligase [Planctomycetota bacterium]
MSTDSRSVREGDLFVALTGENHDGHEYVGAAFRRGAAAALIHRDIQNLGGFRDRAVIRVEDTRSALGDLARCHRRELDASIVAVTGSNGKTTVKDLAAHLLEPAGPVVKAQKSYNNDVGLPLTLLSMGKDTRVGVVEMGTNHPGEIAALCRIARPDVGVVTNVGEAHLEGFGGILGVAEEKGALVEALPGSGIAFVNYEDYHCREMERRASCPVVRFGFDPSADLWGLRRARRPGGLTFYLYGKMEIQLGVPGLHNAMNALASVGVALHFGVSPLQIQERLRTFTLPEMRLTTRRVNGVTVVNDAYNANPTSVAAAIEELRAAHAEGRRVLVIGDMHELGEFAGRLHRQVGRRAARAGIHVVWAVGEHAGEIEAGCRSVARWKGDFFRSASTRDAVAAVPVEPAPGDVVLVKGSRRMRLERIYDRLAAQSAGERVPSGV